MMEIRRIAGAALAAALVLGTAAPALAAEPNFRSESALGRFLLPYSPFLFDLAVQSGRSFAEITYGTRDYDPVTRNFVVADLHIRRFPFDLSIRRLRAGESATVMEGVSVDTTALDLPPPLRDGLRRLDLQTVTGDVVMGGRSDPARSAYDLRVEIDLPRVGALSLAGTVDGFHVLVPLSDVESGGLSQRPAVLGTLRGFSASYRDAGLIDAAIAIAAEQQGVPPEQLAAGLAMMPQMSVPQLLGGLRGGASLALQAQATEWARTLGEFLKTKGTITASLDPAEPVPLTAFQTGSIDEPLIAALNPHLGVGPALTTGPARPLPVLDPQADPLGAARAMIAGDGVLQDQEGGAALLLRLAREGDERAVEALAAAFGSGAPPDLAPADSGALYEFLLVGRALGSPVSDAALSGLAAKLSPMAARGAEAEAGRYFRTRTEAGQNAVALTPENIAGFRPSELRAKAFDAYEGRGTPRDFTEAYALALVASAAGDPLALTLRDDLASAAESGRLFVSTSEARGRAAELWAAYAAGSAAMPPAPEAPQPPAEEAVQPPPPADAPESVEPSEPQPFVPKPAVPRLNTPMPTPQAN